MTEVIPIYFSELLLIQALVTVEVKKSKNQVCPVARQILIAQDTQKRFELLKGEGTVIVVVRLAHTKVNRLTNILL